jgi:hypothetical protein
MECNPCNYIKLRRGYAQIRVSKLYNFDTKEKQSITSGSHHTISYDKTRVEAGSNTSTVNLRVVRGDEMGLKKAAP